MTPTFFLLVKYRINHTFTIMYWGRRKKAKISNSSYGRETGNISGKTIKQSLEFSRAILLRYPSNQIFDYLILIFEENKLAYMPPNCSH